METAKYSCLKTRTPSRISGKPLKDLLFTFAVMVSAPHKPRTFLCTPQTPATLHQGHGEISDLPSTTLQGLTQVSM